MEQTGFGSDGKYEITEKTLLKDKLKVTKDTGRITAIENTSLTFIITCKGTNQN